MSLKHIKAASMLPGRHGPEPHLPILVPGELPLPRRRAPEAMPWRLVENPLWKFENGVPAMAFVLFAGWLLYLRHSKARKESKSARYNTYFQ